MIVGVLTVDVAFLDAQSLKDKRRVVQSVKQKLRNRFNASVAEVDYADLPKRCRLAMAMVSTDSRFVHSQMDKMVELVRGTGGVTLIKYEREVF